MRDYNKIADRVFRRRDEYLEEKKRKKAVYIKRFSVAVSCCIVLMLGLGIWKMDLLRRIAPDDGDYHDAPPVTTTSVSTDIGISTETTARTTASADTTTTFAAVTSDGSGTTSAAATSAADTTAFTTARTTAQERPSAVTTAPRTTASGSEEHIRTTSQSPRTTTTAHGGQSGALPTTTKAEVTSTPRTTSRHITTTTRPRTTTTTRIHTTRTTTRVAVITTTTVPVFTQPPVTSTRWGLTTTATTTTVVMTTITGLHTTALPVEASTMTQPAYSVTTTSGGENHPTTPTLPAGFAVGDVYYRITGTLDSSEKPGELIDTVEATDAWGEPTHVNLYRYEDNDPQALCAAQLDGDDTIYLCIPYDEAAPMPSPLPRREKKSFDPPARVTDRYKNV